MTNDALATGEQAHAETVTMTRADYQAALKYARVHTARVAAIRARDAKPSPHDRFDPIADFERIAQAVADYADELEAGE